MENFQIKIFKEINQSSSSNGGNITISPLSIYHILSLTANGADGDTKKEMLSTLCEENQEKMNEKNKLIYSIINEFKTVEIANSIFTRVIPLTTFIEKAKDYKAKIDKLKDVDQINKWCSESTHGLIENVVKEIKPDDLMVLINAIYFKGKWKIKFNERLTKKKSFYNCQKEKKLINFMNSEYDYNYFENNEIQAISLNYQNDNIEALIILPKNEYDINKYTKGFNQEEYNNIINGLNYQKVELYLPKFEIKFETQLEEIFQKLGIKLAFNPDKADFSSMIKLGKIYISKIIHSTFIKIDEIGTEAAATSSVVMTRGRSRLPNSKRSIIMDINHPFIFIIRNKELPLGHDILFISKVEDINDQVEGKESKQNNGGGEKERIKTDFSQLESVNISFNRPVKLYMYVIKQVLKTRGSVEIRGRVLGAAQAVRVSEALKILGYISYEKYYTTTVVNDGILQRFIIIKVKKTENFQKLFDEREAERKKILENKEKK